MASNEIDARNRQAYALLNMKLIDISSYINKLKRFKKIYKEKYKQNWVFFQDYYAD